MRKVLLSAIAVLMFAACGKEEDDAVSDPCSEISCENGGECVNGACDCPENYDGPDCSNQVEPSRITVNKIYVHSFPGSTPSGEAWDEDVTGQGSRPDLILRIGKAFETDLIDHHHFDAVAGQTYEWDLTAGPAWYYTDLSVKYMVELFDEDMSEPMPSSPDKMAFVEFDLYDSTNGFPSTITATRGNFSIELEVEYKW